MAKNIPIKKITKSQPTYLGTHVKTPREPDHQGGPKFLAKEISKNSKPKLVGG